MDYTAAFNQKLMDFADDLLTLKRQLGLDVPQLDMFKPSLMLATSLDPTQPRQIFHEAVAAKYGRHIRDKNEKFFLENDSYHEDIAGNAQMDLISMIKKVWTTLTPNNKSAIWGHLQLLMAIDDRLCQQE